jgi:tRNA pseudouridine13 synthase
MLTAELTGIGGRIKQLPEDFDVEEIPAYEPCGSGDYLYLWIEKRALGAEYFVRQLARKLDIPVGEVGTAGLKDRHAVTRQMVSVPLRVEGLLDRVNGDGMTLLKTGRHDNKLKPGHLRGNRFRILVRDPVPAAADRLPALLERLKTHGLPNYYGPQRFGHDGETLRIGLAMLSSPASRSRKRPESTAGSPALPSGGLRPPLAMPRSPFMRKLALSAAQSALFNQYLARRLTDGLLRQVLAGDVMSKRPFGGMFVAVDLPTEQQRFEAGETVHAGPIFGRKTFRAAAVAAEREAAILQEAGLTLASFEGFGKLVQGTRRHNLVFAEDLAASAEPDGIRLSFTLPAGSYATVLLQEIMKSQLADADAGD